MAAPCRSTGHPLTTAVSFSTLLKGGNAFDHPFFQLFPINGCR